jgi:hypothetical protein
MTLRAGTHFFFAVGLIVLCGCAGFGAASSSESGTNDSTGPMTQAKMEFIFADNVDAIMGPPGAIQTRVDGINVYLISDPENDRMRIVAPISMVEGADPRVKGILLRANFHSTLDARYAISDGVIYGAFLHPISSLSPELLQSALAQVLSLAKTFGSSFSSGGLHFVAPDGN